MKHNFNTLLASLGAASRAPCYSHSVSSWDRSSNFGALELRWRGSHGQMYPIEGVWSQMHEWRATAFVNFTRRIGFHMSELFCKKDFGGFMSWKTQQKLSCIRWSASNRSLSPQSGVMLVTVENKLPYAFVQILLLQDSYCTFCQHSFWTFCLAVHQPGDAHKSTFPQTDNHSWSCRTSILEGATFHRMIWCMR